MDIELCTGLQEDERELGIFLMAHPEYKDDNPLEL